MKFGVGGGGSGLFDYTNPSSVPRVGIYHFWKFSQMFKMHVFWFFELKRLKSKKNLSRSFATEKSLKIHQGKACMKKIEQYESSDYKTQSKTSLDTNHSRSINATAKTSSRQETAGYETGASDSTWEKLSVL